MALDNEGLRNKISGALQNLTERERRLLTITAAVALVCFVALVYFGVQSAIDKRAKNLTTHQEQLSQIRAKEKLYRDAEEQENKNTQRLTSNNTSLFSLLQKSAQELGMQLGDLNERKVPTKDAAISEVSVDLNLKDVTMDKLDNFLEKVEGKRNDGVVKVTKLKVKTQFANQDLLDVSMTVSTWKSEAAPKAE